MFQSMTAPGQIDDEAVVYLVAAVLLLIVFSVVVMMLDAGLGKQAVFKAHSEDAVVIQGISSAHSSTIFFGTMSGLAKKI